MKIKVSKKPTRKSDDPNVHSVAHYNAILIEELKSEFKFVIEHVQGVEDRLTRRMDEKFAEVDANFDDMRRILGSHSEKLNSHSEILDNHSKILDKHSEILDNHSKILDKHSEILATHSKKLDRLETRLVVVEGKLDTVIDKVERHDVVLKRLTA